MAAKHYQRNRRDMGPVKRLGMQLLAQGAAQAEVARELGVSRTSASNWAAALACDTLAPQRLAARDPAPAAAPVLSALQASRLDGMLRCGARAYGFPGDAWTMARLAVLVECEFGLVCSSLQVWRMLHTGSFLRA